MRILHVVTRGYGGGTQFSIVENIKFEVSKGHEVYFASSPESIKSHAKQNGIPGCGYLEISRLQRSISPVADIQAIIEIRKLLLSLNVDVIHTHESKAGIVGRMAGYRVAPVSVHTVHMAIFKKKANDFVTRFYKFLEKCMGKRTDILVFVGTDLEALYKGANIIPRSLSLVMHSRVNLEPCFEWGQHKVEAREFIIKGLNLNPSAKLLITVGMLENRKRHDLVLKQLQNVLRASQVFLLVAGVGYRKDYLISLASELGIDRNVIFLGFQKDIAPWIAGADVLVHASNSEGLSQVLLQAAASKTKALATSVEGLDELPDVWQAEVDGSDLADKVLLLLDYEEHEFKQVFDPWSSGIIDQIHEVMLANCERLLKKRLEPKTGI